jgi:predicted helicase
MSIQLIQQYHAKVERIIRYGSLRNESALRKPFHIREKFNTYRFADYKEQVIDLLLRVTTVSVETMKIVRQMPG